MTWWFFRVNLTAEFDNCIQPYIIVFIPTPLGLFAAVEIAP